MDRGRAFDEVDEPVSGVEPGVSVDEKSTGGDQELGLEFIHRRNRVHNSYSSFC